MILPARAFVLLTLGFSLLGCQSIRGDRADSIDHHLFLQNIAGLEGRAFEGSVDPSQTPGNTFAGERLVIHVLEAGTHSARIALHVGEDRSRVWVLTRPRPGELHLRHDHRDPDGTPHEVTDYGGFAAPDGTPLRQRFPADAHTARLIPEAATNVWTMELTDEQFVYALTRHGEPRFRAVFDLTHPLNPE
jgi:hypothetical protein